MESVASNNADLLESHGENLAGSYIYIYPEGMTMFEKSDANLKRYYGLEVSNRCLIFLPSHL